jgi:hypothetical protein
VTALNPPISKPRQLPWVGRRSNWEGQL